MTWQIEQRNGLHLPEFGWHLDARKPVSKSFVSHAHFDHMGDHKTILCSPATAQLIQQRIPGKREWHIHDFGEPFELEPGVKACLYPAGHIVGSAMLWLEKDGQSLLYTGDFKLTPGISAEPCQPVSADTLIIESTYGIPRYTFPPEKEVFEDIIRFSRETLENGDTPVLFGYSLGKSQAILRSLAEAELEAMLHPASLKLTRSCQKLGWSFPPYYAFEPRNHSGKVIICPPLQKNSEFLKSIHNPKTAMISGWAIDPSAIYRYQCDKAFPLSDHADYLDLLSFVDKVQPREVFTVHGFAREFAETLRSQGYKAWALGRENQLGLNIDSAPPTAPKPETPTLPENATQAPPAATNSLFRLALAVPRLAETDSQSKKRSILQELLAPLSAEDVEKCIQLLDKPNSLLSEELPPKLVRQSLALATNSSEADVKRFKQTAQDPFLALFPKLETTAATSPKSLAETTSFLATLAAAPNPIFKQSLLSEQFKKLSQREGKFLYAFLTQSEKTGLTPQLLCQAIADRFQQPLESVQAAYLRNRDLSSVSKSASQNTLNETKIQFFTPIIAIDALAEVSPEAVIEKQGLSVWSEPEHDGLRCQLHKNGEHAELYSKRGERISHLFPELLEAARLIPQQFIADAVVVPWGDESPLPRSELDRRLNRKAEELFLGEEVPVTLWLFDLLCLSHADFLNLSIEERRQKLDTFSVNSKIRITPVASLMGAEQIESALERAGSAGFRGLVFKAANSPYNPLSPTPDWIRLPARKEA